MTAVSKNETKGILMWMRIMGWVAFIGFMIEAGAILVSYGISLYNPEAAKNLYMGLNMYELKQFSFVHYTMSVSFLVAISCMKAYVGFLVIKALANVNMINPFKIEVANILENIGHALLGLTILVILFNGHIRWLSKTVNVLPDKFDIQQYIFMTVLVSIMAKIFKRGVEIQSEHELTV